MIPAHVAAYAAGLHSTGELTWSEVATMVERCGLGSYRFDKLARAADEFERLHLSLELRRRRRGRKKKGYPKSDG